MGKSEERKCRKRYRALPYERWYCRTGLDKTASGAYITANVALLTSCQHASRSWIVFVSQNRCSVIGTKIGRTSGCGLACILTGVSRRLGAVYEFSARSRFETKDRSIVSVDAPAPSWPIVCIRCDRSLYLFAVVPSTGRLPLTSRRNARRLLLPGGYVLSACPPFFSTLRVRA